MFDRIQQFLYNNDIKNNPLIIMFQSYLKGADYI